MAEEINKDIDLKNISGYENRFEKLFEKKEKPIIELQTRLPAYASQDWHKYNLAKCNEKRLFYELLDELCSIIPEPAYQFGRPSIPVKDMVFISALKLYCNYSLRKIHHDTKEAETCGYIKKSPHFNRISGFFNNESTYLLLQKLITITALPLKEIEDSYSLDASGFGSYQYERWMRTRFSKPTTEWRNYVKGHVLIGTRTNIICNAEITFGNESDVRQAPKLLSALKHFNAKEVSADKAYNAKKIFQIIQAMDAIPYIPFLSSRNPKEGKCPEIWFRMYNYFKNHREDFMNHYHKRSNVESVFAMVKMRLGEFLKSKNYVAQRNELLMKFLVHNITCLIQEIYERGIKVEFKENSKKILLES